MRNRLEKRTEFPIRCSSDCYVEYNAQAMLVCLCIENRPPVYDAGTYCIQKEGDLMKKYNVPLSDVEIRDLQREQMATMRNNAKILENTMVSQQFQQMQQMQQQSIAMMQNMLLR